MSKSMAIEGVMKIFLMIAVIIVGMSFLLKAFGIDLLGWLQSKLGGFDIPSEGKALHVKTKISTFPAPFFKPIRGIDVWEFHLVSSKDAQKHWTDKDESHPT